MKFLEIITKPVDFTNLGHKYEEQDVLWLAIGKFEGLHSVQDRRRRLERIKEQLSPNYLQMT